MDENPLSFGCGSSIPFWFGLSGGLNLSKVNYNDVSTDYLTSGQISFEIESFVFSNPKKAKSALLYGLSYESKNYNILNSKSEEIELESNYLTVPIKYQHLLIDIGIPFNILLGGFYSLKLNENSENEDIEFLPSSNYGIILGSNAFYFLRNGMYIFIEYNLQYGFAALKNTTSTTNNISHIINIGFKFPSTAF